jgi:hypothetical protein
MIWGFKKAGQGLEYATLRFMKSKWRGGGTAGILKYIQL